MPKLYKGHDFEDMRVALQKPYVQGGMVTPGAAVNVNVSAIPAGHIGYEQLESVGATNLAVTAGAQAGESVVNAVVVNKAGTVSVIAGTSAPTASAVAPTVDEKTYALLATVIVANGASSVVQGNINNKVRNLP